MARNRYDTDEKIKNEFNLSQFLRIGKYVSKYKKEIIFSVIIMLVTSVLTLLPPYFTGIAVDKCFPDKNIRLLLILVVTLIISELIIRFNTALKAKIINRVGESIVKDLRNDLFSHLQKLPLSYFDSRPNGKILIRIVNYTGAISSLFSNGIIDIITNLFTLFVIIAFMLISDVTFTFICMLPIPFFIASLMIIKSKHKKSWQSYSSKQSNMTAYISENIEGMKITQSFARENQNLNIFRKLCNETKKYWLKARYIEFGITPIVEIISVITTAAIYLIGVGRISNGNITLGILITFAAYVSRFWGPVANLTNFYNQIVNCSAYIERIFELLDEPVSIKDLPEAKPIPQISGNIKFENVTFSYDENEENILENFNLEIEAGKSIAFVGATGAGKSTIINLLARFYDIQKGNILIDNHNIKNVTLDSLRSQIGIMLQDSFLFNGTVKDNIKYGNFDATDEEIVNAAKTVCAHNFIMSLPKGYDTVITGNGSSLSVGQKQLIAFARTLLLNPRILVLDEATSSIDTETEMLLQKGLNALLKNRTSLIIAHRLSTIKQCDNIMYISNKKITEKGSHDELIALKGKYFDLYKAQFKFIDN